MRNGGVSSRLERSLPQCDVLWLGKNKLTLVRDVDITTFGNQQPDALLAFNIPITLGPETEDSYADQSETVFVLLGEIHELLRLRVRKEEREKGHVREDACPDQAVHNQFCLLWGSEADIG